MIGYYSGEAVTQESLWRSPRNVSEQRSSAESARQNLTYMMLLRPELKRAFSAMLIFLGLNS
jgi:hypothetical protein